MKAAVNYVPQRHRQRLADLYVRAILWSVKKKDGSYRHLTLDERRNLRRIALWVQGDDV